MDDQDREVYRRLIDITGGKGVRKGNIGPRLGDVLRDRWHVDLRDPHAMKIAICQLDHLIEETPFSGAIERLAQTAYPMPDDLEAVRNQLRVAFFIVDIPGLDDEGLDEEKLSDRLEWFGSENNRQFETRLSRATYYRHYKETICDLAKASRDNSLGTEELAKSLQRFGIQLELSSQPTASESSDEQDPFLEEAGTEGKSYASSKLRMRGHMRPWIAAAVIVLLVGIPAFWFIRAQTGTDAGRDHASSSPSSTPLFGAVGPARPSDKVKTDSDPAAGWALPARFGPAPLPLSNLRPSNSSPDAAGSLQPDIQRFDDWVYNRGGATVGVTHLRVVLTAGQDAVQVQDICARISTRAPSLKGTLFFKGTEGDPTIQTSLNLDSSQPCVGYFRDQYKSLQAGESAEFDVSAVARKGTVTWSLYAQVVVKGEKKTIEVDPKKVMRTAGLLQGAAGYSEYYNYEFGANGGLFRPTVFSDQWGDQLEKALENSATD
jgi:hypothetical protein